MLSLRVTNNYKSQHPVIQITFCILKSNTNVMLKQVNISCYDIVVVGWITVDDIFVVDGTTVDNVLVDKITFYVLFHRFCIQIHLNENSPEVIQQFHDVGI